MRRATQKQTTRQELAGRLYGAGSCLVLWGVAGLVNLLPAWLSVAPIWAFLGGALLWGLGLLAERPDKILREAPQAQAETARAAAGTLTMDPGLMAALKYRDSVQAQLDEEAENFPVMLPQEEFFASAKPIEMTFEDLGRLPSLVQRAIEDRLDESKVKPIDRRSAPTARGDRYRIKFDGPRYDVRTLRSVN